MFRVELLKKHARQAHELALRVEHAPQVPPLVHLRAEPAPQVALLRREGVVVVGRAAGVARKHLPPQHGVALDAREQPLHEAPRAGEDVAHELLVVGRAEPGQPLGGGHAAVQLGAALHARQLQHALKPGVEVEAGEVGRGVRRQPGVLTGEPGVDLQDDRLGAGFAHAVQTLAHVAAGHAACQRQQQRVHAAPARGGGHVHRQAAQPPVRRGLPAVEHENAALQQGGAVGKVVGVVGVDHHAAELGAAVADPPGHDVVGLAGAEDDLEPGRPLGEGQPAAGGGKGGEGRGGR